MPTTKVDITLQVSASNAAGATATGGAVGLATGYGAIISVQITNGATGPTVGCTCTIEGTYDGGTNWFPIKEMTAYITALAVYDWLVEIPMAVQEVRSVFTGNTGQAVTVEAVGSHITAI